MDELNISLSDKDKNYITKKLQDLHTKVAKLKRKRTFIKILYYSSITLSITLTGIMNTLSSFDELPKYLIPILSTSSGISTGLSAAFNFLNKKTELNKTIHKIHRIQENLEYIASRNGDLTDEKLQQIILEIINL